MRTSGRRTFGIVLTATVAPLHTPEQTAVSNGTLTRKITIEYSGVDICTDILLRLTMQRY